MPTPGSTELRIDELMKADRLDRDRISRMFPLENPASVFADNRVMSETTVKTVPLTPEVFENALREIGLVSPRPGMVLGATVTAHPLAFAVLGRALQEAREMGLEIEDWKLLQILSASLTHLDARLGMKPSCGPSEGVA